MHIPPSQASHHHHMPLKCSASQKPEPKSAFFGIFPYPCSSCYFAKYNETCRFSPLPQNIFNSLFLFDFLGTHNSVCIRVISQKSISANYKFFENTCNLWFSNFLKMQILIAIRADSISITVSLMFPK